MCSAWCLHFDVSDLCAGGVLGHQQKIRIETNEVKPHHADAMMGLLNDCLSG
jgi:hypothetical protein